MYLAINTLSKMATEFHFLPILPWKLRNKIWNLFIRPTLPGASFERELGSTPTPRNKMTQMTMRTPTRTTPSCVPPRRSACQGRQLQPGCAGRHPDLMDAGSNSNGARKSSRKHVYSTQPKPQQPLAKRQRQLSDNEHGSSPESFFQGSPDPERHVLEPSFPRYSDGTGSLLPRRFFSVSRLHHSVPQHYRQGRCFPGLPRFLKPRSDKKPPRGLPSLVLLEREAVSANPDNRFPSTDERRSITDGKPP